jgi:F0F1-type ATP synthase membrane subunit b/b'
MSSLFNNLGLDWKLLLSQAVNFFILLAVLKFTVYGPLVKVLAMRKKRIEQGLMKAAEADKRLEEITVLQKEKLKEAEGQAMVIMQGAEERGKLEENKILAAAAEKEKQMMQAAAAKALAEKEATLREAQKEAVQMIKGILIKTVGVAPQAVDEALIKKVAEAK